MSVKQKDRNTWSYRQPSFYQSICTHKWYVCSNFKNMRHHRKPRVLIVLGLIVAIQNCPSTLTNWTIQNLHTIPVNRIFMKNGRFDW